MTTEDEQNLPPIPEDKLALASVEASIAVMITTAGLAFGPLGAVFASMIGPFGKRVVMRFMPLHSALEDAGFDQERLLQLVDGNESFEQLVAQVVRGTVESDLAAKRTLLARALIAALNETAEVDVVARFVSTATQLDTADIRVLALINDLQPSVAVSSAGPYVSTEDILEAWPGASRIVDAVAAHLLAVGLINSNGMDAAGANFWSLTEFGEAFLDDLRSAGLEDELQRRAR